MPILSGLYVFLDRNLFNHFCCKNNLFLSTICKHFLHNKNKTKQDDVLHCLSKMLRHTSCCCCCCCCLRVDSRMTRQSLDELSQARGRRRTQADSSDDSVHQSEDTFSVSESQSFLFLCVCVCVFKLLVETNILAHLRKANKVLRLC